MEKVTLYIPCFNAEKTLGKCLESVLKQNHSIDEILIIDDGSTDKTVEISSKFDVKLITHKNNEGLGASRNTAIKNAKNEFIAALDSDCTASGNWLEKLMKNFKDNSIAGVGGRVIESCDEVIGRWRDAHMGQAWGEEKIVNPEFIFGSNTVFRKSALEQTGYNHKYRTNYEDVDLSQRLMKNGFRLVYEPHAVVRHLRKDTIGSVMKSSWAWTFHGFKEPNSVFNLLKRLKFNTYKMFRCMFKDLQGKNFKLVAMDLMILPMHTYSDIEHYLKRR